MTSNRMLAGFVVGSFLLATFGCDSRIDGSSEESPSREAEGGGSPEEVIARAVEATKRGDLGQVIDLIEPAERRSLQNGMLRGIFLEGDLTDLEVEGSEASARIGSRTLRFQRIEDRWYISGLSDVILANPSRTQEPGVGPDLNVPQAPHEEPERRPIDPETVGRATIRVLYGGVRPEPSTFDTSGNADCHRATGGTTPKELLVVSENGRLANALVHVTKGHESWSPPAASSTPVILDQKDCRYVPHVVALRVDQPLRIENSDPFAHNVHVMPRKHTEFNQMQRGEREDTVTTTFEKPEIGILVRCDVHSWMSAYIHVLEHPWFGITGDDGEVTLEGLPPGKYTVSVWHEKGFQSAVEIEVPASGSVEATVTIG